MPAPTKREMRGLARERPIGVGLGAVQVEAIRIGEATFVAVGRGQKANDFGTRRQCSTRNLHFFTRLTRHHMGWRRITKRFGDRSRQDRKSTRLNSSH